MNNDVEWSKKSPDEKADYLKRELENFINHQNKMNHQLSDGIGRNSQDLRELASKVQKLFPSA